MKVQKNCPLFIAQTILLSIRNEIDDSLWEKKSKLFLCMEQDCAWYDEKLKVCAITK
jgi:hypothetical protein